MCIRDRHLKLVGSDPYLSMAQHLPQPAFEQITSIGGKVSPAAKASILSNRSSNFKSSTFSIFAKLKIVITMHTQLPKINFLFIFSVLD